MPVAVDEHAHATEGIEQDEVAGGEGDDLVAGRQAVGYRKGGEVPGRPRGVGRCGVVEEALEFAAQRSARPLAPPVGEDVAPVLDGDVVERVLELARLVEGCEPGGAVADLDGKVCCAVVLLFEDLEDV